MENNVHIIRFKDGLDIICQTEPLDSYQFKITNPMTFEIKHGNLLLQYWLPVEVMKGNAVAINTEDILCIFEPSDTFSQYYSDTVFKMEEILKNKSNVEEDNIHIMEALKEMELIKGSFIH